MGDGYTPCPAAVFSSIATQAVPALVRGTLLDNVAGEGGAAAVLAAAWNLAPFFVELDPQRARACAERDIGPVCVGSAEDVVTDGQPSVWYFNPPFDPADPEGYLEQQLFSGSVGYALLPGTLAIILLPTRALTMPEFFGEVVGRLESVNVRAFPEPYAASHRQFVVFGYGRGGESPPALPIPPALAPLRDGEFRYAIPRPTAPLRGVRIRERHPRPGFARRLDGDSRRDIQFEG